ncbi:MAG: hypothetical protein R6V45_05945, partial [Oceanipulchritudo sp.]
QHPHPAQGGTGADRQPLPGKHLSLLERLLAEFFACPIQVDPVNAIQGRQLFEGIRYLIE